MRKKLEQLMTPDEFMEPKPDPVPREKVWNPAHLRTDKKEEEFTKEEVEAILKTYTDPDLGGLRQQAPDSFSKAFGGENEGRVLFSQNVPVPPLPVLSSLHRPIR